MTSSAVPPKTHFWRADYRGCSNVAPRFVTDDPRRVTCRYCLARLAYKRREKARG